MIKKTLLSIIAAALVASPFVIADGSVTAANALAQETEKKVISTSTDSRGFERRHTEVDLMFQTAKQYLAAGQYKEASLELEKVMAADGSRLDALHELGTCYTKLKDYKSAATAYKKAVALHPDDTRLLTNLGMYQLRAKDKDGALVTYTKIVEKEPNSYEGNKWLAYIYGKTDEPAKALEHYEAVLKVRPDDMKTMGSMAGIYMELGDKSRALAMYERAIPQASEKDAPKLKSKLGKLYIGSKDYAKSAKIFGELVEHKADVASWQYNLAISYIQLKRAKDAVPHLEKAIEVKPEFCLAYQQLANALNDTNAHGRAMTMAKKGLSKCPDRRAAMYYQIGRALEGQTLYDEAIESFELAASDPTWGPPARKQIERQQDLIKREQLKRGR